jgi:plasmid stabilization system protein ParE
MEEADLLKGAPNSTRMRKRCWTANLRSFRRTQTPGLNGKKLRPVSANKFKSELARYSSSQAEADLREAARWYESQRQHLGGQFLDEISRAMSFAQKFARTAPVYYRGFRRMLTHRFPYKLFYRIEGSDVISCPGAPRQARSSPASVTLARVKRAAHSAWNRTFPEPPRARIILEL